MQKRKSSSHCFRIITNKRLYVLPYHRLWSRLWIHGCRQNERQVFLYHAVNSERNGGERIQTVWHRVTCARLNVACGDVLVKQTIVMSIYSARHQIFIQGFTWGCWKHNERRKRHPWKWGVGTVVGDQGEMERLTGCWSNAGQKMWITETPKHWDTTHLKPWEFLGIKAGKVNGNGQQRITADGLMKVFDWQQHRPSTQLCSESSFNTFECTIQSTWKHDTLCHCYKSGCWQDWFVHS